MTIPCRLIREVGVRGNLRIYWERVRVDRLEPCGEPECKGRSHPVYAYLPSCPNAYGKGTVGIHNAYAPLGDIAGVHPVLHAEKIFGKADTYPVERWPIKCKWCDAPVPLERELPEEIGAEADRVVRHVWAERIYDTPSAEPEVGDLYYASWQQHGPGDACLHWDNCDGRHLHAVLPDGHHWDIDGRAANCTLKDDRLHRCWVKTGSPEAGTLSVGKGGVTCSAGAGSIQTPGWHGFLSNMTLHT